MSWNKEKQELWELSPAHAPVSISFWCQIHILKKLLSSLLKNKNGLTWLSVGSRSMYCIQGPPQSGSKFFSNINSLYVLHKASVFWLSLAQVSVCEQVHLLHDVFPAIFLFNRFIADLALHQHLSFIVTGVTVLQCEYPMQRYLLL